MDKWEYKIDLLPNATGEDDLTGWLNSLGQEGWELIECAIRKNDGGLSDVKGIFKRKIQQG